MKKMMLVGALALGLAAVSQQQASAWCKVGLSCGFNFNYQSGNNSFLWGAVRNGQVPGYPTDLPTWVSHYPPSNNAYGGGPGGPGNFGGGPGAMPGGYGALGGAPGGMPYGMPPGATYGTPYGMPSGATHGQPASGDPGYTGPPPQGSEPPANKGGDNGDKGGNGPVTTPAASAYGYNGYQNVGYYQAAPYQAPAYSYPSPSYYGYGYYGSYGYSQAPSYWYGY